MPPKRSLFADSNQILLGIHHGNIAWIAELTEIIDAAILRHDYHCGVEQSQLGDARDGWVTYDLQLFSGRADLSDSHKQIWRREVVAALRHSTSG